VGGGAPGQELGPVCNEMVWRYVMLSDEWDKVGRLCNARCTWWEPYARYGGGR